MRWAAVPLTAFLLAIAWTSPADAHGNVPLVDRRIVVQPGTSITFEGELHYHRLVARITADAPLIARFSRSGAPEALIERSGTEITINELIRCCERGWTRHVLVLENRGATPATADASASLVHDDLAVMAYGAEPGISESIVILGGIWAVIAWRTVRRPATNGLARVAVPVVGVIAAVLALSWYGAVRFGVSGPPGYLAGLSQIPLIPANPIVSGATVLLGATMFGWAFAARRWAASSPEAGIAGWLLLGASLAGSVVLTAASLASTYGGGGIHIASALAAGLPLVAVLFVRARGPGRPHSPGIPSANVSGDRTRESA